MTTLVYDNLTSLLNGESLRPGDQIFSTTGVRLVVSVELESIYARITFLHLGVGMTVQHIDRRKPIDGYFWRGYTLIRTRDD